MSVSERIKNNKYYVRYRNINPDKYKKYQQEYYKDVIRQKKNIKCINIKRNFFELKKLNNQIIGDNTIYSYEW